MKVIAFTDTHSDAQAFKRLTQKIKKEKPELLFCCGDITIFGHELETTLQKINSFGIPCYIIHGNHEDESEFRVLCKQFDNLHFMHKNSVLLENVHVVNDRKKLVPIRIYGIGGDGFSYTNKEFRKQTKKWLKTATDDEFKVLLTHAPPVETNLDIVESGEHSGNKDIKDFIVKAKVEVAFSGHIHESSKATEILKSYSLLINPGPDGMLVNL